jgi:hypothetical protein
MFLLTNIILSCIKVSKLVPPLVHEVLFWLGLRLWFLAGQFVSASLFNVFSPLYLLCIFQLQKLDLVLVVESDCCVGFFDLLNQLSR